MRTAGAILSFWILSEIFALRAYGQTFEDGYQPYMRNQYPVAELQFKAALKKVNTKEDQAFILKFIGICQYMRSDKKLAAASFFQAVSLDRGITVDESEVLDPGVISFFTALKSKWIKENRFVTPPPVAQAPAAPAQAAAASPQEKTSGASAKSQKVAKSSKMALAAKSQAKTRDPKQRDPDSRFSIAHLLPLGTGQFYNGSYILGSAFAAVEIFGIYRFLDLNNQIKERDELEVKVAQDERLTADQILTFNEENKTFISDLKSDRTAALGIFVGFWAIGIIEAIINAPQPEKVEVVSANMSRMPAQAAVKWNGSWLPNNGGQWLLQMHVALP